MALHPAVKLLADGCADLKLPDACGTELIRFLQLKRLQQAIYVSPGCEVDRLWHWMLLNTEVAEAVYTFIGGRVQHSTKRLAGDEELSVRRLTALSFLKRDGHQPDLQFWREPNTLLHDIAEAAVLVTEPDEGAVTVYAGRFSSEDDLRRIARDVWGYDAARLRPILPTFADAAASSANGQAAGVAVAAAEPRSGEPSKRQRTSEDPPPPTAAAAAPADAGGSGTVTFSLSIPGAETVHFKIKRTMRLDAIGHILADKFGINLDEWRIFGHSTDFLNPDERCCDQGIQDGDQLSLARKQTGC